ncbi:hypothetical protein ABLE91_20660 [Aquabacter sp. CN5-332]|uniref:hypothetical protein n=1 Tax=Aquabacter sp. CN5-332 TaxID=3156608 RepID=UPI0032B44216
MASRLLAYDPELETFEGETAVPSRPGSDTLREMARATMLLELRAPPALRTFLRGAALAAAREVGARGVPAALTATVQRLEAAIVAALRETPPRRLPGPFGATLGSRLVAIAGSRLGLELEGLSHEDQEFQVARRLVRFVEAALRGAARAADPDPEAAARRALAAAAARLAPGLIHPPPRLPGSAPTPARQSTVPPGSGIRPPAGAGRAPFPPPAAGEAINAGGRHAQHRP